MKFFLMTILMGESAEEALDCFIQALRCTNIDKYHFWVILVVHAIQSILLKSWVNVDGLVTSYVCMES